MGASNWPGLAIPKPEPRWKSKRKKVTEESSDIKDAYQLVDERDERKCRICRRWVGGIGMLNAVHHHHLISRSIAPREIKHTTGNIASLCNDCHDLVENSGLLRISGDADARDPNGVLCGLTLERAVDGNWEAVGQR